MTKVFFPTSFEDVPASAPHAPNTSYRVARGIEHWGEGESENVYKVQMVYDGVVSGRRSPSFPDGTDDFDRVLEAMKRVRAGKGKSGRGKMQPVGPDKGLPIRDANALMSSADKD